MFLIDGINPNPVDLLVNCSAKLSVICCSIVFLIDVACFDMLSVIDTNLSTPSKIKNSPALSIKDCWVSARKEI